MESSLHPPRKHKFLFWLIVAAYSTFFAEVFAGSDMFPFFHAGGLVLVVPLYGLHTLILTTLIYRRWGRPHFATLVFAGMLFGLYEAYITKMLWRPSWEAWLTAADVAVVEVFVLLWWHTWFSYITPLTLTESLLTTSRDVLRGLPLRLRRFYGSWKGWLALALFGAVFQSINSPDPAASLLSGLSTVAVLTALTLLWQRVTRGRAYALSDLLPGKRAFRILALWLGAIYLITTFTITPERIPPVWPGQVIAWGLYALAITLFVRALRRFRRIRKYRGAPPPFPSAKSLLGAGLVFVIALPLAKIALSGAAAGIIIVSWLAGGVFEIWAFLHATRETLRRPQRQKPPARICWLPVGAGQLTLYHRPRSSDFPRFKKQGATHIVSLLAEREGAQKYGRLAEQHGLAWVWLPMPGADYPQGEVHDRLAAALPELSRLLDEGARILIHCSAGIHRTGMVAYALLRWRGYTPKEAMRAIRKMRKITAREMQVKHQQWGDDLVAARGAS